MELHLGEMKNKELAEWFNMTPKSFANLKKKKLEELEIFADFDIVRGGVIIKSIKIPVYAKQNSISYEKVKNEFDNA